MPRTNGIDLPNILAREEHFESGDAPFRAMNIAANEMMRAWRD